MSAIGRIVNFGISILIAAVLFEIALNLNLNRKIHNHEPGTCKHVKPVVDGSEDIELLPNGIAIVTSGLRFIDVPELANVKGKLFLFDMNAENMQQPVAKEIKIVHNNLFDIESFNPHGISSHINEKGEIVLYIVNHGSDAHSIEVFQLNIETLMATHLKTIKHELFHAPNDLIVMSRDEFYVTNLYYFNNFVLKYIEFAVPSLKLGSVIHCNNGRCSTVDNFLRRPNGIAVDSAKKFLYLAVNKGVRVYSINDDKSLKKLKDFPLGTSCDNLFVEPKTNFLWSGCHPVRHEITAHINHPKTKTAPTQVLRLKFSNNHQKMDVSDVYSNDGAVISSGTIGVTYKKKLLIGSVAHKLLLCEI